jgi:tetratricopeptide (TPR) repeat protein
MVAASTGLTTDWAMLFELGLRGARADGDRGGECLMPRGLGNAAELVGGYEEALEHYIAAHELATELDDTALTATAGDNLGGILAELGRFDEAERYLRTSLELYRRLGDRQGGLAGMHR